MSQQRREGYNAQPRIRDTVFLGHALLAFALAALIADWRDWPARRALTLGVVAGAFAAIPDVDVAYAAIALDAGSLTAESVVEPSTFWDATRNVHRTITHSLVIALLAGPPFGLWAGAKTATPRTRALGRGLAIVILTALIGVAYAVSGLLGGVVMGLFAAAGVGVATLSRWKTTFSARTVAIAATAGLLSHPWGDLLTGDPPGLFYPFGVTLFDSRVLLHADPTIHLLGAFAVELSVIWLAALTTARIGGLSWWNFVDRRASVGVAYGIAAPAMAPPTLDVSYHFVFSILSVGLVCGGLSVRSSPVPTATELRRRFSRWSPPLTQRPSTTRGDELLPDWLGVAFTALAGITVALLSYATVYIVAAAV